MKKKGKSIRKKIRIAGMIIACLTFLVSAFMVGRKAAGYLAADRAYTELKDSFVQTASGETVVAATPIPLAPTPARMLPTVSASILPTVGPTETAPVKIDFDALLRINEDVIGWLYCEGTPLDYPVVQGTDNSYYLTHLLTGENNFSGCIFADYRSTPNFGGKNTVLYAHNMQNGSMFACLEKFSDPAFFQEHPTMYLLTPTRDYRVDLFSGHDSWLESVGYTSSFLSDADFLAFSDQLLEKSDFFSGVTITAADRILTLSTCSNAYNNARYVLHGLLVPLDGD